MSQCMLKSIGRFNLLNIFKPPIEMRTAHSSAMLFQAHDSSSLKKSKDKEMTEDKETHTGQKWQNDDFRLARFVSKEKQINERFAINLIAEQPPVLCKDRVVHCDGGKGPLGHPRVYINLDQPGNHTCGYCGLRFYKEH